jgi:hypothetical protein
MTSCISNVGNDSDEKQARPLVREGAPQRNKTVIVKQ